MSRRSGNGAGNVDAINSCDSPTGAIPAIVPTMDDEIDIVITGHTNWAVNCIIDGKVVTGAASQGRLITDIDAKLDRADRRLRAGSIQVNNRIVTQDVAKAADLTALIAEYNVFAAPIASVVVGNVDGGDGSRRPHARPRVDARPAHRRRPAGPQWPATRSSRS